MEFRLLGPLEVVDDAGQPIPLGPPRQRALLAALCLNAGATLSIDRLIDTLWDTAPPATAATILHGSVAGLRRALEAEGRPRVIVTESGGYRLDADPECVDTARFERMTQRARDEITHDAERAWRTGNDALALWRGRALQDIDGNFAAAASARLDELRSDAIETRAQAALATGRHLEVIASLEDVVAENPLRERAWTLLLAALHRAGRGAEALARYERIRERLVEELGVDPSPQLRATHEAILRDDVSMPSLDLPDWPTGVTTFLLTDIEGSSALWESNERAMRGSHARHQSILRECAHRHRGVLPIEQGEGDSAVLVFARATDAVTCAIDVQRSLASEPWPDACEIKVRVGMHTGEAEVRDGTYYGVAINRCARIRSLAHGGQVLLSNATADVVADALPDGASLVDLGSHRLRDLARAERVWQLVHPVLGRTFPPLRGAAPRHNLPAHLTALVGRGNERKDIRSLLERHRLVTLVGPGGSGKTRLGLEVAGEIANEAGAGVWLVELAQLLTPELVLESVANVMGLKPESGRTLADTISSSLSDQDALLVLDNCEHVLEPCAMLARAIVSDGERSRVLTTSREALGVPGEAVYAVGPLGLPDSGEPWDRIAASEAVRLFAERAAAARPGFVVDETNASLVLDVCARLDGMPLALELAAARAATTPLRRIADRLDDRFRLLDAVTRAASPRHRSLEAAVQWSYDLLDDEERRVFDRLSVFAGSFTLEAAVDVVAFDDDVVSETLSRLVARSLLQLSESDERYRSLETLREYGRARLDESGESRSTRERHAKHFLNVAELARPSLHMAGSASVFERLAADEGNYRAALDWSLGPDGDAEFGIRLACALWFFWEVRGAIGDIQHWVSEALRTAPPSSQRAFLLSALAMLHMHHGEFDDGLIRAEEAVELVATLDDPDANDAFEAVAVSGWARSIVAWIRGDVERARDVMEEAIETCLAADRIWYAANAEYGLARVLRDVGDSADAEAMSGLALAHAREVGEDEIMGFCLELEASLAHRRGEHEKARGLLDDALGHYRAIGYREGEASALAEAGRLALAVGTPNSVAEAGGAFRQAFDLCRTMGHRAGTAAALEGLSRVLSVSGDAEGAAMLLGGAMALREEIGAPLPPAQQADQERELERLRAGLGAGDLDVLVDRGRRMSLDELAEVSMGARLAAV